MRGRYASLASLFGMEDQTGKSEAGRPPLLAGIRFLINIVVGPLMVYIWAALACGVAIGPILIAISLTQAFVNFRTRKIGLTPAFVINDENKDTKLKQKKRRHIWLVGIVGFTFSLIWLLGGWPHSFIRWMLVFNAGTNRPMLYWSFKQGNPTLVPSIIMWIRASIIITFPMYLPGILGDLDWRIALETVAPNVPNTWRAKPMTIVPTDGKLDDYVEFVPDNDKPQAEKQSAAPQTSSTGQGQLL